MANPAINTDETANRAWVLPMPLFTLTNEQSIVLSA